MKIAFNLDDKKIEGELMGASDFSFITNDPYVKEHYKNGVVFWTRESPEPSSEDEIKIYRSVGGFAKVILEIQKAIDDQDYPALLKASNIFNEEITLPDTKYVVAPSHKENKRHWEFRSQYQRENGNTDFYKPEPYDRFGFFEVITRNAPDHIIGYDFVELFS